MRAREEGNDIGTLRQVRARARARAVRQSIKLADAPATSAYTVRRRGLGLAQF